MRSMTLTRYSAVGAGAALAASAFQVFNLSLEFPIQHVQLAWSLTRVLLQL
jgi:hypothetical protein